MVLFVQCITVNLFCRWRVRRKTQSPSSLFRLSYGEHSEKFHHVAGDWAVFLLLLNLNFSYSLCVFFSSGPFWVLSRTIFSIWWFRSASRRLAKAFSAVKVLLTSSGSDTLYNGTFLFLTGSVVRPEEDLLSKPQCCNLQKWLQCETFDLIKQSVKIQ